MKVASQMVDLIQNIEKEDQVVTFFDNMHESIVTLEKELSD
jgi:hypothetical protein